MSSAITLPYIRETLIQPKTTSKGSVTGQYVVLFPDQSGLAYIVTGSTPVNAIVSKPDKRAALAALGINPVCKMVVSPDGILGVCPASDTITFDEDKSANVRELLAKHSSHYLLFSGFLTPEMAIAKEVSALCEKGVDVSTAQTTVTRQLSANVAVANAIANRQLQQSNEILQAAIEGRLLEDETADMSEEDELAAQERRAFMKSDEQPTELSMNDFSEWMPDDYFAALNNGQKFTKRQAVALAKHFVVSFNLDIYLTKTMTVQQMLDTINDALELSSQNESVEVEYSTMR